MNDSQYPGLWRHNIEGLTLQIHVMYFKVFARPFPQPSWRIRHRPESSKLFRRSNRRIPGAAEDHNRLSTGMCVDDTWKPIIHQKKKKEERDLLNQNMKELCLLPTTHLIKSEIISARLISINKFLKLHGSKFLPEVLSMCRHMLIRCVLSQPSRDILRVRHGSA